MLFWILIYDMWPCIALGKVVDFPTLTCIFWNSMTLCLEWTFLFHLLCRTLVDKILSRWQNTEAFSLQLFIPWRMYLVGEFQEMRRREQKSRNSSSRHTSLCSWHLKTLAWVQDFLSSVSTETETPCFLMELQLPDRRSCGGTGTGTASFLSPLLYPLWHSGFPNPNPSGSAWT